MYTTINLFHYKTTQKLNQLTNLLNIFTQLAPSCRVVSSHTYNNKRANKKETKKQCSVDRIVDQRSTSLLDESCHHTYLNNSLERWNSPV